MRNVFTINYIVETSFLCIPPSLTIYYEIFNDFTLQNIFEGCVEYLFFCYLNFVTLS